MLPRVPYSVFNDLLYSISSLSKFAKMFPLSIVYGIFDASFNFLGIFSVLDTVTKLYECRPIIFNTPFQFGVSPFKVY